MSKSGELLALVDDGVIDYEFIARCALNWMGENEVQEMIDNQPEFDGLGLGTDDDDE